MRHDLPAGTVTFVFTDIEGSTALLRELGSERYGELLAQHHRVCRVAWAAHGGVEVDTAGDAFFVAFPTASAALAAAGEAQDALAELGLRVRMGVHTGEVAVVETGYVGFEVHRAARIASAAHGGQVVVSGSAAAEAGHGGLVDLGEHRFKDVLEPVPIFQLGEGSFPPLKTISNTNLPRPASSFVGREVELGAVLSPFEQGARLVTLTGPGGSGKTRLALEAAATHVPEYKAGVFWVGLAALRDPALVTETIAQTLGAKDGLAEHIGTREMLLLLDNLEQVIDAAPELSALLRACPKLRLLVTSRELLRIDGEVEYAVPPLAEPEAMALFCERAQTEPSDEIGELCERLDNLPLAVELAAARTKALAPAKILERLSQRLDLLKGGRDADPRQQTLRATIEWSYDLLSDEEQRLFRALSVFVGGCTLEAAELVGAADPNQLQSLVEKSLLRLSDGRYWMLETVREYAAEHLRATADENALLERRASWILSLVRELGPGLRRMEADVVAMIAPEQANIRDVIRWALEEGAPDVAYELVGKLCVYWMYAGAAGEGARLGEKMLAAPPISAPVRFEGLTGLSDLLRATGEWARSATLKEEAIELLKALDEELIFHGGAGAPFPKDEVAALLVKDLAQVRAKLGEFETATALADDAIARARAIGDESLVAYALFAKGVVNFDSGHFSEARDLFEQTMPDWLDLGSLPDIAEAELMVGKCLRREGVSKESIERIHHALDLALECGHLSVLVDVIQELAAFAVLTDRAEAGARLIGFSERLRDEAGSMLWDTPDLERTTEACRDRLGADAFTVEQARGAALTNDEAVALARSID